MESKREKYLILILEVSMVSYIILPTGIYVNAAINNFVMQLFIQMHVDPGDKILEAKSLTRHAHAALIGGMLPKCRCFLMFFIHFPLVDFLVLIYKDFCDYEII